MNLQIITTGVFIHKDGQVLLVKRADTETFASKHWELPGGHVDFGETIEEALTREALEETGLDVVVKQVFHAFTYVLPETNKHYVEIIMMAQLKNENQKIQLHPAEHSEYKWISHVSELEDLEIFHLEKKAIIEGLRRLEE